MLLLERPWGGIDHRAELMSCFYTVVRYKRSLAGQVAMQEEQVS